MFFNTCLYWKKPNSLDSRSMEEEKSLTLQYLTLSSHPLITALIFTDFHVQPERTSGRAHSLQTGVPPRRARPPPPAPSSGTLRVGCVQLIDRQTILISTSRAPGPSNKPALHSPHSASALQPCSLSVRTWNRLLANWWGWAGYAGWFLSPVWDPLYWSSFISKVCSSQVGSSVFLSHGCVWSYVWCMAPCLLACGHIDLSRQYSNAADTYLILVMCWSL